MATGVSVAGANGTTLNLHFNANVALARQLADAITKGVESGSIIPSEGSTPPLPAGKTGEFVSGGGFAAMPTGYNAVVVPDGKDSEIFGSGGDSETVLSGTANLTFIATGGSGTVVAGGGDQRILIPQTDNGNWGIYTDANDLIAAMGGGNDTISAGAGHNDIQLGSGHNLVLSSGADVINIPGGAATVDAATAKSDLVFGGASALTFIGGAGNATVFGGTGSDTFLGGSGNALVHGGTGANNLLFAGTGHATLFGGGNGDQLFAEGSKGQELIAGAGNETLFGGFSSGNDTFRAGSGHDQVTLGTGHDTFFAGTGTATVVGVGNPDTYVFTNGQGGGSALLINFTSLDKVDLSGFAHDAVEEMLHTQKLTPAGVTVTLPDHTRITFAGLSSLNASQFSVTNPLGESTNPSHHGGKLT
jgi:Ca2+-binding RTX toxin-like protein